MKQEQNIANSYEEISWTKLADSMQTIQSFSKLSALPKSNMALASPTELDLLSRIALSDTPLTPAALSDRMGMKKSAISRLIHSLGEKNFYLLLALLTKANNSLIKHKKNAFSEIELSKNFSKKEDSEI